MPRTFEPLSLRGYCLPLRPLRGGDPRRRLRPCHRFLHRGKPLSFVYDIADIFKFDTVVPAAFTVAARVQKGKPGQPGRERL